MSQQDIINFCRYVRKSHKVKQEEIAKRAFVCRSQISYFENGYYRAHLVDAYREIMTENEKNTLDKLLGTWRG